MPTPLLYHRAADALCAVRLRCSGRSPYAHDTAKLVAVVDFRRHGSARGPKPVQGQQRGLDGTWAETATAVRLRLEVRCAQRL